MSIKLSANFDNVYALVGAGFAISKIGSGSRYMTDLINAAYEEAEKDFNRDVVAFASATGKLGHMFEWGTVGINKSKSNMRPDPMSEKARLWQNEYTYYRGHGDLRFTYKPSAGAVPKPTKAKTGIPSDVLARLKTHVFFNKAMVLEEGLPVLIKPKKTNKKKLLFVPRIWKGEQGYDMYSKPTTPNISEDTQGTFSTYWAVWWETMGSPAMNDDVEKNFTIDLKNAIKRIESASLRGNKVLTDNNGKIKRSERTVLRYLEQAAQERLRNG